MQYKQVKVSEVIENKHNPSIRTDRTNRSFNALKESIREIGLLNPILIAADEKSLVAGHRRLNAFKDLGIEYIPAIIHHKVTKTNYDKMFVIDHQDQMPLTAAQETERYLNGAKEISVRTLKAIKSLEAIGGRNAIRHTVAEGKSPTTYLIAIAHYTGYIKDDTRKAKRECLYWMFNVDTAYKLKTAIHSFVDADIIRDCVVNRKPLTIGWLSNIKGVSKK
tara:strand:+ start:308 stop:970 length:663 start_codon:yes stop_codon:yes gene_type:complete